MQKRALLLLFSLLTLFLLWMACGKKAAPAPPIIIAPQPPESATVMQSGKQLLFAFPLPTLSTDYKTPATFSKIQVYRLKDPRIAISESAQTQPQTQTQAQTQPQTQQPQTQTQAQTQPQTQPQTQTSPTQLPPEQPRSIPETEFKQRAEKIAEIPEDLIDSYLRGNYFLFTDSINLAPDSEDINFWHYYAVKIYSQKGKSAGFSRPAATYPAIVPKVPSNFTATVAEKKINLSWTPVTEDFAGKPVTTQTVTYNLYRGSQANFAPLQPLNPTPLTATTFTDNTFQYGQSYYYFVRASFSAGRREQESAASNSILIFPQDIYPPGAPQELDVVSAKEGMVLIWAPNPEDDVAGYNIYRSLRSGSGFTKINSELVRETTYTDTDVKPQQRYYYVITAVDNAPTPNESSYSAEASEAQRR